MKEFAGKDVVLIVENNAVPFDKRVWREALALKDAGANISVICPKFGVDGKDFEVLDNIEIHRYKLPFSKGTNANYVKEYAIAFVKTFFLMNKILLHKKHVDVVHVANPPDIFWLLALYLKLFGVRFIFDEHDLSLESFLSRLMSSQINGDSNNHSNGKVTGVFPFGLQLFQKLSYKYSDAIIATNESYRANAIKVNKMNAGKTFIVRNGPDTRYFRKRTPNLELKKGFRYMAAYIGIMGATDGVDYIIYALNILVNKHNMKDLIIYLIGTGDEIDKLKQLVVNLNLSNHVVFTGRIPDEPALEILSTADVCLSPDPFSPITDVSTMNKVMEYMSLGKPIVSFDLKEARYSARNGALFVDNNNPDAFAEGILELIANPEKASRMGIEGEQRIADELCWQKQIDHLLEAYRFVLN